jgi:hypothetical protein
MKTGHDSWKRQHITEWRIVMYVLYGALGCLACLLLVAIGVVVGWKIRGVYDRGFQSRAPMTAEEEKAQEELTRKLKAEQQAFRVLQNYSTERAYGMTGGDTE